jgi:signal transduction histidine kinase
MCACERRAYAPDMPRELRKLIAAGGAAVWLMVGIPIFIRGAQEPWRLAAWSAAYVSFGVVLALALRTGRLLLTVPQAAAVIALVLILCDGFEGALLVLVALQLGGRTSRRAGLAAIALQSAALFAAIAIHWNRGAALLLAPPYLGFQLLAYFAAEGMWRLARTQELRLENERLAERLRISRELHDRLGHHLTALRLNLEVADRSGEALAAARDLSRGLLAEVRGAVEELRDPERVDLCVALRAIAEELPTPRVHVEAPASLSVRDPLCATAILRCAQEIATNAARHASASNLWFELVQRNGMLELRARDDGEGAPELRAGNGLRGMRERVEAAGGTLTVDSGAGFAVRASVPLRSAP